MHISGPFYLAARSLNFSKVGKAGELMITIRRVASFWHGPTNQVQRVLSSWHSRPSLLWKTFALACLAAIVSFLMALSLLPIGVPIFLMYREGHPGFITGWTWDVVMLGTVFAPFILALFGFCCGIAMGFLWNAMIWATGVQTESEKLASLQSQSLEGSRARKASA